MNLGYKALCLAVLMSLLCTACARDARGAKEQAYHVPGMGLTASEGTVLMATVEGTARGAPPVGTDGEMDYSLVGGIYADGLLELRFTGAYTDGRAGSQGGTGGWEAAAEGIVLKGAFGEKETVLHRFRVFDMARVDESFFFSVEGAKSGDCYTLELRGAELSVTLDACKPVKDLVALGVYAKNEQVEVVAVPAREDGVLRVELLARETGGLDIVGFDASNAMRPYALFGPAAALGEEMLCVEADGKPVYRRELTDYAYTPAYYTFEVGDAKELSLELPFVVVYRPLEPVLLLSGEGETERIELDAGSLDFVQDSAASRCTLTRSSAGYRICGVELLPAASDRSGDEAAYRDALRRDGRVVSFPNYTRETEEAKGLQIDCTAYAVTGVYYAIPCDFTFDLH